MSPNASAARPPEERRRRERDATDEQHHHAVQERPGRAAAETGISSPGSEPNAAPTTQIATARMSIANDDRRDVPGQLLERDRPPALRRRREQVEAALGGLAGERPGQGDDRPQAEQDRQEVADAPGQEAAQRLEVDRLAEQAAEGRRQRRSGRR